MQPQKQGSTILKVCGILMIIGGALSLVGAITVIVGFGALGGAADGSAGGFASGAALGAIVMAFSLIAGIIQLIAGIFGVKFWATPPKALSCCIMGCIVVVLKLADIFMAWGNNPTGTNILNLVVGLVLPALYLFGAFQLKKQA